MPLLRHIHMYAHIGHLIYGDPARWRRQALWAFNWLVDQITTILTAGDSSRKYCGHLYVLLLPAHSNQPTLGLIILTTHI